MIEVTAGSRPHRGRGAAPLLLLALCSCAGSSTPPRGPDFGQVSDTWSSTDSWNSSECDGACADLAPQRDTTAPCPEGRALCGAECVDLTADQDNCGQCGEACDGEATCVEGNCMCRNGDPPPCTPCKTSGQSCSGDECCEGLTCGYYGSSLACKRPDA